MTPEQRLDLVERILKRTAKAERRARREWRLKFNSLIDARIRHEAIWRARSEKIDRQLKDVAMAQAEMAVAQGEFKREMADLARSQKLTDKALRAFIDGLRKGP